MLKVEDIHDLIQKNKAPCFRLKYLQPTGRFTQIATYDEPGIDTSNTTIEERLQKSIEFLNSILSHYRTIADSTFEIKIRTGRTVSSENAAGEYRFMIYPNGHRPNVMNGYSTVNGFSETDILNSPMYAVLKKEFEFKIEQMELAKTKEEIEKKQAEFESGASRAGAALVSMVDKLVETYLPELKKTESGGIGATASDVTEETEEITPEREVIEDIATELFKNESDIEILKQYKTIVLTLMDLNDPKVIEKIKEIVEQVKDKREKK